MSWYVFMASDMPLEEYCLGVYKEKGLISIPDEQKVLVIHKEEYTGYTDQYTKLPHLMSVKMGKYEFVWENLVKYIQPAAKMSNKMEIWSVWLDDPDTNILYRKCKAEEIEEPDIAWIFDQQYFEHPQCLKIYKWRRGKK